jgi:hypothetical protein
LIPIIGQAIREIREIRGRIINFSLIVNTNFKPVLQQPVMNVKNAENFDIAELGVFPFPD